MNDLFNLAQAGLGNAAWTEIISGNQTKAQQVETMYICNTTGVAKTFRLALIKAGEDSASPANSTELYYQKALSAYQTIVVTTDLGLHPGDSLFGYGSATGVCVSVFGRLKETKGALRCVSHVALAAAWQLVIDGDQVGPTQITSVFFCNLDNLATIHYALAFVKAGDAWTGTPAVGQCIFSRETISPETTDIKQADFGLLPGDKIYAWTDAVNITASFFGR